MKNYKEVTMKLFVSIVLIALFALAYMPVAMADPNFNQTITPEQQAVFDQMLEPVMKVYMLIKYCLSVVAVIILLWSGAAYMTSGSDPKKRDTAKNIAMFTVIGLAIAWAAPFVVQFILG